MAPFAPEGYGGGEPVTTGFWGPRTSTLDWCEGNYDTTDYVAEFWNTMSNIVFILPPIFGIYFAWRDKVEARFIFCYLGVMLIGVGSICFHLTLHLSSQMLDEMSMLWSTSFFFYCIMETNAKPGRTNDNLLQVLYIYNALVGVSYVMMQQPLLFQVAFGSLTVVIIARAVYVAKTRECNKFLLSYSVVLYVVAFTLWNADNQCCDYVQRFRASLPPWLSGLTQLHAWWHLLVGISCHAQIQFCCQVRYSFLKRRCTVWTWCGFLPFLTVHDTQRSRDTGEGTEATKNENNVSDSVPRTMSPKEGALLRSRQEQDKNLNIG